MLKLAFCLPAAGWLLPLAALANDTRLNMNIEPPQQLNTYRDTEEDIRMAAEYLRIEFDWPYSTVEVEFVFENLDPDNPRWSYVGFPDEDLLQRHLNFREPERAEGDLSRPFFFGYNGDYLGAELNDETALLDFTAWTYPDGEPAARVELPTRQLRIERIAWEDGALRRLEALPDYQPRVDDNIGELMFCHAFELKLEPGERRVIGHRYRTYTGSSNTGQKLLSYTFGTGANWAGTIGSAQVDVRIGPGFADDTLVFAADDAPESTPAGRWNPDFTLWEQRGPREYRLLLTDFEPANELAYLFISTRPWSEAEWEAWSAQWEAERAAREAEEEAASGVDALFD